MSENLVFTVYAEGAQQGAVVTARLRELCAQFGLEPQVSTVDVRQQPDAAERANIVGVPTVVRESPYPRRRVIGGLDDGRRVGAALGLDDIAGWDRSA